MVKKLYVNKNEEMTMKTYIKPQTDTTTIMTEFTILVGTGNKNVVTGGSTGEEYTSTDPTYGKESTFSSNSLWDEEEE